jgi:sigma-54 dependent transcriptional regulator, acetoin dehydrogenase operon transcriptional activator AcoR
MSHREVSSCAVGGRANQPQAFAQGNPTRAMPEQSQIDSLSAHLGELCELFCSLLPDSEFGIGVYDSERMLISSVGVKGLPNRLPKRFFIDSEVTTFDEGHAGVAAAYERIPSMVDGRMTFAVCASTPAQKHTLSSLCRMGSGFLARTIDLLRQAKMLRQVVREQVAIIDHMSDGLLVLDRSGILRYLNVPGGKILGIDPAASVGRVFREILDVEPFISPIFSTGHGHVDRELQIRIRNCNLHLIDTAVPIVGEDGEVVSIVNTFREMAQVKRLSNRLAGDRARYRFADVLGHSRAIKDAVIQARRAARSDATVLLYGESGTGKEVFAQSIHNDGRRVSGPFVVVNCAALPRDLIESELFGYAPGSFTGADKSGRPGRFELASGGSIFLDEISEMPLDVQAKILRVLQERQVTRIGGATSIAVDVRVIAAANRSLTELVAKRAFREDLFYRLNVVRIDLPALRERREDIARLVDESIRRSCASLYRSTLSLTSQALAQLEAYDWPGNVRQLQNVIERLVNMTDVDEVHELPSGWLGEELMSRGPASSVARIGEVMSLEAAERFAIRLALEATGLNVTKAADALGITRPTLYAKMKKYGLETMTNLVGVRQE